MIAAGPPSSQLRSAVWHKSALGKSHIAAQLQPSGLVDGIAGVALTWVSCAALHGMAASPSESEFEGATQSS